MRFARIDKRCDGIAPYELPRIRLFAVKAKAGWQQTFKLAQSRQFFVPTVIACAI
jgi:hypothetical protein